MDSSFEGKRVLITGATGLIGSHLAKRLLKEGASVIALGRSKEKIEDVFAEEFEFGNFEYMAGNIAEGISADIGVVDYIFHAASPISGAEIKTKPVDTIEANLSGAKACMEYLKKQKEENGINGRLVIFSSATVYGNQFTQDMIVTEEETDKADRLDTANTPYSESKRMIEVLARAYYTQYLIESVIVRIGYVYGYSKNKPNTAFYEFIKKATAGEDIVLNNSGMGRRDNIHVDDVVSGLIVVGLKGNLGEAYNISSNGEGDNFCAIDEMAVIIAECMNELRPEHKIKVCVKPLDGERNPGLRLDNSKLKALGWSLKISLKEGIKETVKSYI